MKLRLPLILLICFPVIFFNGCASYNRIADFPKSAHVETVSTGQINFSKGNELPVGAYFDEKTKVIVAGHQKGLGVGMMFGLVGVLVADQMNKSSAEKQFGASAQTAADLDGLLRGVLQEQVSAGALGDVKLAEQNGTVSLSPYAVFTVRKTGTAFLHVMLKARLAKGPDGKEWWVRYFARAPGEFPIQGEGGWMTGDRYQQAVREAMRQAVKVFVDDTRGRLTVKRTVEIKGAFPFLNMEGLTLRGLVVDESDRQIVVRLAVGDLMVMSGTHIFEKSDFSFTDKDFSDPRGK